MNDLLKTAFYFLDRGIATIPIRWRFKKPNLPEWECYQVGLPSEMDLRCWFASRLTNIAVITGWANLAIIDFDNMDKYYQWHEWCQNRKGAQHVRDHSRIVYSARGAHVYVQVAEPAENAKYEGIDILAQRKYALLPPSIHPSGTAYRYRRESGIITIDNINDILPDFLRVEAAREPLHTEHKIPSIRVAGPQGDIWDQAESDSAVYGEKSLVEAIRARYRVEMFFPDAQKSSRGDHWLVTKCPFHRDNNPSFWIDTDRQICGCYSGCTDRPLDVINLYARLNCVSNEQAIDDLKSKL